MLKNSPWFELYTFAPPHFPFCDEFNADWVLDPIDTYSSFFYTIVAVIIYFQGKHSPKALRQMAWIPFFLTFGSILFHMSFTYIFLVADFLGIFFLSFYGINLNFVRLGKVEKTKVIRLSMAGTILYGLLMALLYSIKVHTGLLMLPLLFILIQSEWRCFKLEKEVDYSTYKMALALIVLGYIAMLLEGIPFQLGCLEGPFKGKLQLHLIWHLFSAISMVLIFRFYNQEGIRKSFQEDTGQ